MLIPILCFVAVAALIIGAMWRFVGSQDEVLRVENQELIQENGSLLRRAKSAEWDHCEAVAGRVKAEKDALSTQTRNVELENRNAQLKARCERLALQCRAVALQSSHADNARNSHLN